MQTYTRLPTTTDEISLAHHQIRERLRQQIGRQWLAGQQLPPIPQLARQLQTGQTNTHRAVKALVAEGLLISRRGKGTFVRRQALTHTRESGHPYAAQLPLAGKTVAAISNVVRNDEFIEKMICAMTDAVEQAGGRVVAGVLESHDLRAPTVPEADCLAVFNPNTTPDIQMDPTTALVVVNTAETPIASGSGYDVVTVDQDQGGYLAGRALHDLGLQQACYLGTFDLKNRRTYSKHSARRLRGFERGWGRPLPGNCRLKGKNYQEGTGAQMVADYIQLRPRPEGVFACSDELAVGFVLGARAHGLVAGRDYQIIGFDGQLRGRELDEGPLTTVDVPTTEMGRHAAELLIRRLAQPDRPVHRVCLGCDLFQGATTRLSDPAADMDHDHPHRQGTQDQ